MPSPPAEIPALREAFRQLLRLVKLVRPYWEQMFKGVVLGLLVGLLGMATPYLTKLLIDQVYPSQNVTLMHVLVGGILAVSVASSVMGAIRSYFTLHVNSRLNSATSLMFFNHLQHLTPQFFDQHRVGEIMSRFSDVRRSLGSISNIFGTLFTQGIYLILVPPFLFLLQWKLALVAIVTIPLTVAVTTVSARILRRYYKYTAEAYADLSAYQVEVLSHIRTFKALALEGRIYDQARSHIQRALGHQLRAGGLGQLFGAMNGVIGALGTAILIWYGWTLILGQDMTLGSYVAFMAYIGYFTRPLRQLTTLFANFQETAVNLGRMFEYVDAPTEQDPATVYEPEHSISHVLSGHIQLLDVSFAYDAEKPVLRDVDLELRPGTVTALVGASGAGKSSLLRLIARMGSPHSGQILIDGTPMYQIPLSDLRRQLAVVWQEVSLISGTLWENLTLGAQSASREQVKEAVRLCRLEGVIDELKEGYEARVAEWGATLSGGQRQRVALARALVRDTPILLLDEATSHVDIETEAEILKELFAGGPERTILFVTHRVASAAWADQVCVLERGRVFAVGSHAELFENCATYRRMQASRGSPSGQQAYTAGSEREGAPSGSVKFPRRIK